MSHFYPNRARGLSRWGSLSTEMFGVQYVLSCLLNTGMFPIKQRPPPPLLSSSPPPALPNIPPPHPPPATPLMIPLIFPQEPRNAGLQIQRVIKKRCVYSKEQKLWNERVKSRGEKKERKKMAERKRRGRERGRRKYICSPETFRGNRFEWSVSALYHN